ncbi:ribonuclease PH [uncultured Friedmanniella sp.]|uniref:ribonuclease PH n=1 Tax=uncultured Friedmanniella sp. TaxID=335381 RepID=UPI0035CADC2D
MKRRAVLKSIKAAADKAGLTYSEVELTNHTGIIVGGKRSTIGRHNEVDEVTVLKFYKQFEDVLGKGWWK